MENNNLPIKETMSAIRNFFKEAGDLTSEISAVSNIYAGFEDAMQERALNFPFKYKIKSQSLTCPDEFFFSWHEDINSSTKKNFRLFLVHELNATQVSSIPIRQTKMDIRIKWFPFFIMFIEEYTKEITRIKNELKENLKV